MWGINILIYFYAQTGQAKNDTCTSDGPHEESQNQSHSGRPDAGQYYGTGHHGVFKQTESLAEGGRNDEG